MSLPPPSSENLRHGVSSLCDLAHHTLNSHPTPARDVQDNISDTPTELPPLGRGATGVDSSSPSIASSDGSLEDFYRLPDLQNNIPIDPAILADDAPWDIIDLHQPVQQGDDLANPKAIYPYPEPPLSMPRDPPNHHQGSGERPDSWNRNSQTDDDTYFLGHRQIHPARCGTDVDVPCSYSTSDDFPSDEQSRRRKRGPQQPEEPAAKRLHVASVSPVEGSSTALRSHFLSLQLDERLQFLSWLFEGALASCIPDSAPAIWGDENVRPAGRSAPRKVGETRRERGEGRKGHRDKLWRWFPEDDARLLGMMEERRPWPEIETCFPERTESALRQRVSTLRKQERGMRTAERAGVTAASATPEAALGRQVRVALIGSVLIFLLRGNPQLATGINNRRSRATCPSHCHAFPSSTVRSHSRMIPTLLAPHGDSHATAVEGTPLLHEFYFQTSSSDIVGCCAVLQCLGRATRDEHEHPVTAPHFLVYTEGSLRLQIRRSSHSEAQPERPQSWLAIGATSRINAPFRHPDTQAIRQRRGWPKVTQHRRACPAMASTEAEPRGTIVINDDTDAETDAPRSPP
ncbi:hypothetical protein ACJ73_06780 [Blastomyces percursus]|uniref:Myb-like domain-containing protein n=1 Tax=Blastomyces percursus TaxID=1658174 RepID=A0A1J9PZY7_9EURO|nr:hypothetical protein ACJ73_06780 [Blastomyces percursus]